MSENRFCVNLFIEAVTIENQQYFCIYGIFMLMQNFFIGYFMIL